MLSSGMRRVIGLSVVLAMSISSIFTAPVANAKLKSPYEIKLKSAKKVTFGQPVPLAVETCKVVKKKYVCSYEKFIVTVNSFSFYDKRTPIDVEVSTFAIDLNMQNFSSQETGLEVGSILQCKSSRSGASFYSESIDPQYLPPKSEDSGIVIASFPDDIAVSNCETPVLWLSLTSGSTDLNNKKVKAKIKKKKLVGAAYIVLTPEMLSSQ